MHYHALITNPHTLAALAGRDTTSIGRRRRRYARVRLGRRVQPKLDRVVAA
jgi:hypothetical protein